MAIDSLRHACEHFIACNALVMQLPQNRIYQTMQAQFCNKMQDICPQAVYGIRQELIQAPAHMAAAKVAKTVEELFRQLPPNPAAHYNTALIDSDKARLRNAIRIYQAEILSMQQALSSNRIQSGGALAYSPEELVTNRREALNTYIEQLTVFANEKITESFQAPLRSNLHKWIFDTLSEELHLNREDPVQQCALLVLSQVSRNIATKPEIFRVRMHPEPSNRPLHQPPHEPSLRRQAPLSQPLYRDVVAMSSTNAASYARAARPRN